jgi:asparagine synthetase B (glutamine-hydrolysing)
MCGVLFVESRTARPLQQHLVALDILSSRGPDFVRYQHTDNVFIAQSVLHITGSADFYNEKRSDFFAYNGEIYNYHWHGRYSNDTELAYQAARDNHNRFQYFEGPWAWVYWDGSRVTYATDPQGEHYLYRYQDDDIVVVCSEVAPILTYIQGVKVSEPYKNKHWTLQNQTPWQGIERLTPGQLYVDHVPGTVLDSVWSWIKPQSYPSQAAAEEEFSALWTRVMREMTPRCNTAISYSGGIDSNLILIESGHSELVATNMIGKDPIVDCIAEFLTEQQKTQLTVIDIDPAQWAQAFKDLLQRTQMPAQSWSFVGKWIVAQHVKSRVIFSGIAADELFGGYEVYNHIQYDQDRSHSPYSQHCDPDLWHRCLNAYDGDAYPATLLADYWSQIVGCDAPGQDRISGAWGKETRNPFMNKRIMEFALNLPSQYRRGKPLLKTRFLQKFDQRLLLPKKGFTGHANDALPWMNIDVVLTGDRYQDWKTINQQMFANLAVGQTKSW